MLKSGFVRVAIGSIFCLAIAASTAGCQYSGAFEGKRCSKQSDCAGEAACVEGYCVSTDTGLADTGTPLVANIAITPESLNLRPDETQQLSAAPTADDGTTVADAQITWETTDEAVAAVDADGVVTAIGVGTAIISASADGAFDTAKVVVTETPAADIAIGPASLDLQVGDDATLSATVFDPDGQELPARPVTWSSDTPTVAVVDDAGLVSALSVGEATITATSGEAEASATVTVGAAPADSIELSPTSVELTEGDQFALRALVRDVNQQINQDLPVTWTSSDDTIATVDANGTVTAVSTGGPQSATATITAESGGAQASADVTVIKPHVATIAVSPRTATLQLGASADLTARALAADTTELTWPTITWTSSDDTIASVDANGTVEALQLGTAVITASADGVERSAAITVVDKAAAQVDVSPASATIEVGATTDLSATVLDANSQPLGSTVIWESSDNAIAVVDSTGQVLGVGSGSGASATATITARTTDGQTGTATVEVTERAAATIDLNTTSATLEKTHTLDLQPTVRAADGTILEGRSVSFTSADDTVASVDANGTITAQDVGGPVTITATSGSATATVDITVVQRSVNTVEVSPPLDTVQVGSTISFTATAYAADGTALSGRAASWTANDTGIATVDNQGTVTGVSAGTTYVSATIAGKVATAAVRVERRPVAAVIIDQANQTLSVGSTRKLTAHVEDAAGDALTGHTIAWSSADTGIAVVDSGGTVTAISSGQTTIIASSEGQTDSITVDVTATNSAPSALDQSVTTAEDAPVGLSLAGSDPDGDTLTYSMGATPAHGTLSGLDAATGQITYTPDADYNGTDSFGYTVSDGTVGASATVTVTVTAVNDAPVAASDTTSVDEDGSVDISVLTNDTDVDSMNLSVDAIDVAPAHGTATANADGTITYTPAADFNGADWFVYTVSDGDGATDSTWVEVTVNPVNDAPVADAGAAQTVSQGTTVQLDGSTSSDLDAGDTLSYAWAITQQPPSSSATLSDPAVVSPTFVADKTGDFVFELTVTDDAASPASDTASVTITVQ